MWFSMALVGRFLVLFWRSFKKKKKKPIRSAQRICRPQYVTILSKFAHSPFLHYSKVFSYRRISRIPITHIRIHNSCSSDTTQNIPLQTHLYRHILLKPLRDPRAYGLTSQGHHTLLTPQTSHLLQSGIHSDTHLSLSPLKIQGLVHQPLAPRHEGQASYNVHSVLPQGDAVSSHRFIFFFHAILTRHSAISLQLS